MSRRKEAEEALVGRGLPTSITELEWWNAGKRGSDKIIVDVRVPGQIVDWNMKPKEQDHVLAGWKVEVEPSAPNQLNHLRLSQERLMPGVVAELTVGYQRPGLEESGEPEVQVLKGDQLVAGETYRAVGSLLAVLSSVWFILGYFFAGPYYLGIVPTNPIARILLVIFFIAGPLYVWGFVMLDLPERTSKPRASREEP